MNSVIATLARKDTPLLVDSIRTWGGEMADSMIWAFGNGAQISEAVTIPLHLPEGIREPLFADKVMACAEAEKMAAGNHGTMIWMDPECLVLKTPGRYILEHRLGAALRPVHMRNIGVPISEKPDRFWSRIYDIVGEPDFSIETFVDGQEIKAYFNTHAFSVDPALGLMGRWASSFRELAGDEDFMSEHCNDDLHRVFLHQAIFSALLGAELGWDRIRILPRDYNYPYNLQERVPSGKRATKLNDLVTVIHEGRSLDPGKITDIALTDSLRQWLGRRTTQ